MRGLMTVGAVVVLMACQAGLETGLETGLEPGSNGGRLTATRAAAPAENLATSLPTDACWARDTIPAVTETILIADAAGQRIPRERIVSPAQERLFAVPCPAQMTETFVSNLQRALAVRGLMSGPVTGAFDAATAEAVRRYQAPQGLNSAILSLQAAQQLGLVVTRQPSN